MEIFLLFLILCVLVAVYASSKGRSGIGFFLLSFLLSPLIGLIIALIVTDIKKVNKIEKVKKCPACKSDISYDATKCKYCASDQPEIEIEPIVTSGKFCAKCNSELQIGYAICTKCDHINLSI